MKKILFLVGTLLLTLTSGNLTPKTWNYIAEKTWISENGFAGEQIVFYESVNGIKRAIRQLYGSGVQIAGTLIYDVEVIQDTVFLTPVQVSQNTNSLKLICNKTDSLLTTNAKSFTYKMISDKPTVYNFHGDFMHGERIPIEILKSVPIQKGVTFENGIFKNIKSK